MLKLRRMLEEWMGIAPVAAGEDTQWSLRYQIGWPDWVLLLFGAFAVAFVVAIYLREGVASRSVKLFLAAVRLAIVGLLLLMLGELELLIDRTGLPHLVIALDDSESQSVRDRPQTPTAEPSAADPTRLERVTQWLGKSDGATLKELILSHKLRVVSQSATQRHLGTFIRANEVPKLLEAIRELKPMGRESLIGGNVRAMIKDLGGTTPSAIILATDGVTTKGEGLLQVAQYAARKQIPIFTIGVGDPDRPRDLELTKLLVDDTVFIGDDVTFQADLVGRGFEGKEITVSLRGEGIEPPLTQTVKVESDGKSAKVRINYSPRRDLPQKVGTFVYTLDVPVADRELQVENNRLEKAVTFVDEKVRVLIVETYPRYEFRFLKDLLERQTTIDVKIVLIESDEKFIEQDKSAIGFVPTTLAELSKFDVIIFGDVKPTLLSQTQLGQIRDFVSKGGGFLAIAGQQNGPQSFRDTALEVLLPVQAGPAASASDLGAALTQGFSPQLTFEGRTSPIFRFVPDEDENRKIWSTLPRLYWYATVEKKPNAEVLMEHPSMQRDGKPIPLVATAVYGAGRTYYQGFDGVWRWRFQVEDLYHARYWIQALRYLSKTKLLGKNRAAELTVDKQKYRRGDAVQLKVRYVDETKAPRGDEPLVVQVEKDGNPPVKSKVEMKRSPGRRDLFEGVFLQAEDGRYRARLPNPDGEPGGAQTNFVVVPPPGEMDNVQMNEAELQQVAKLTGGQYFPLDQADRLFDPGVLPYGRRVAINTDPPFPLWRSWPMLTLFIALLAVEWIVRKRQRMV